MCVCVCVCVGVLLCCCACLRAIDLHFRLSDDTPCVFLKRRESMHFSLCFCVSDCAFVFIDIEMSSKRERRGRVSFDFSILDEGVLMDFFEKLLTNS